MKLFVLALLFLAAIGDIVVYRGEHIANVLRPLASIAHGIKTGGDIWGA